MKPTVILKIADTLEPGDREPYLRAALAELDERHQGFANYETFAVAVVLDNDRAELERVRLAVDVITHRAAEAEQAGDYVSRPDELRRYIELRFTNWVTESQEHPDGIASTFVSAGLAAVDWLELVEHWGGDDDAQ